MFIMNPGDRILDFDKSAPEGPIVMVNLLKLKSGVELAKFGVEFAQAVGPVLKDVGAETLYTGVAGPEFCAEDDWDLVALVKYPNYQAFLKLGTNEDWIAGAGKIREEKLQDARLVLTQPVG